MVQSSRVPILLIRKLSPGKLVLCPRLGRGTPGPEPRWATSTAQALQLSAAASPADRSPPRAAHGPQQYSLVMARLPPGRAADRGEASRGPGTQHQITTNCPEKALPSPSSSSACPMRPVRESHRALCLLHSPSTCAMSQERGLTPAGSDEHCFVLEVCFFSSLRKAAPIVPER